jgi:hypothetical protein
MPGTGEILAYKYKVTKKASKVPEKASKITEEILQGYEIRIEEDILTSEGVANILNSSQKVIERELRAGKLKGAKRLGKWFVLKSDLIAYIRSGSAPGDDAEDETNV